MGPSKASVSTRLRKLDFSGQVMGWGRGRGPLTKTERWSRVDFVRIILSLWLHRVLSSLDVTGLELLRQHDLVMSVMVRIDLRS